MTAVPCIMCNTLPMYTTCVPCAVCLCRFEPGALGQLSRAVNVTSLHLEVLPESSSSSVAPLSPSAVAAAAGSPGKSPSELARLQVDLVVGPSTTACCHHNC